MDGTSRSSRRRSAPILLLLALACGPAVDSPGGDPEDESGFDDSAACAEGSCPEDLICGDEQKVCLGGFGIAPCDNGMCGPAPGMCIGHSTKPETCDDLCALSGSNCAEKACEGATAFSYPGPPEAGDRLTSVCGKNSEEVLSAVERHSIACDDPLGWSDDVALFQCCCDNPDE